MRKFYLRNGIMTCFPWRLQAMQQFNVYTKKSEEACNKEVSGWSSCRQISLPLVCPLNWMAPTKIEVTHKNLSTLISHRFNSSCWSDCPRREGNLHVREYAHCCWLLVGPFDPSLVFGSARSMWTLGTLYFLNWKHSWRATPLNYVRLSTTNVKWRPRIQRNAKRKTINTSENLDVLTKLSKWKMRAVPLWFHQRWW